METRGGRWTVSSQSLIVWLVLSVGGSSCVKLEGEPSGDRNSTRLAYQSPERDAKFEEAFEDDSIAAPPFGEGGFSSSSFRPSRLEFVPTKLYAQVRRTNTVKHLPPGDALENANDPEEILAAPRLREVVSKSKTNTVYTEEGYEDAAYDHGDHERDAEFQEGRAINLREDEEDAEAEEEEKEEEKPKDIHREEFDSLLRDATINPRDVTENEIAKLETDLEREYESAEKRTETRVPETPKSAFGEDYEEDKVESAVGSLEAPPSTAEYVYSTSIEETENEAAESPSKRQESFDDRSAAVSTTTSTRESNLGYSPRIKFGETFASEEERKDEGRPSADALYESWKRSDFIGNSGESSEFLSFDSFAPRSEELSEDHTVVNVESNDGGSTTLAVPKKLSYTIIIRPSAGTATTATSPRNCPCDRLVDATDFSNANDFTGIRGPQPLPLPFAPSRQPVTYTNFPDDSYPSLAQPSVSREIGSLSGEPDRYAPPTLHAGTGRNPRGNRFQAFRKKPRLIVDSRRRPVPLRVANEARYVRHFAAGKRIKKKMDPRPGRKRWLESPRFYQSFGRRRRSLPSDGNRRRDSPRLPEDEKIREGNLFGESKKSTESDDTRRDKSRDDYYRHTHEKLLREPPRIVDRIIDGEIEARFDEDEKRESVEHSRLDSSEGFDREDEKVEDETGSAESVESGSIDLDKYPFYDNRRIGRSSALKYATDPRKIPRKTRGGTEFYDSRDAYRECDEVSPELDDLVRAGVDGYEDTRLNREQPRLGGLARSLDCFRAKYLDEDPLDNPLFFEERVGQPRVPEQLDPRKLHLVVGANRRPRETIRVASGTSEESFPGDGGDARTVKVGYFRTVTVHKRSVNNEERLLPDLATRTVRDVPTANATNTVNAMKIVYTILDRTRGGSRRPGDGVGFPKAAATMSSTSGRRRRVTGTEVSSGTTETTTARDPEETTLDEYSVETSKEPSPRTEANETRKDYSEITEGLDSLENIEESDPDRKPEQVSSDSSTLERAEEEETSESADSPEIPSGAFRRSEKHRNSEEGGETEEEESRERPPSTRRVEDGQIEFERFASRPFSPFESFEDPKYEELGPRVNKPAFHHPSFQSSMNDRRGGESWKNSGSEESDEAIARYSVPWGGWRAEHRSDDDDDEDDEHRRFERYEYPWERRERLARERRAKLRDRERHRSLYGFDEDRDAERREESESKLHSAYPWERYGSLSHGYRRKPRTFDNEETSSITRPRFSSRYKKRLGPTRKPEGGVFEPTTTTTTTTTTTATTPSPRTTTTPVPPPSTRTSRNPLGRKIATTSTTESTVRRRKNVAKSVANGSNEPSTGRAPRNRRGRGFTTAPSSSSTTPPTPTIASRKTSAPRAARRTRLGWTNRGKNEPVGSAPEKTVTPATVAATSPRVKTVEHRTRFSKERIITKTSYPALNETRRRGDEQPGERLQAEITETPERVSGPKRINEEATIDTYASVTSNDRTNASLDGTEATRTLESSAEQPTSVDEDSFATDSLLENLLRRVPPYAISPKTINEDARVVRDDSPEGSRRTPPDDYEKRPERRLYYYVQDS